MLGVGDIHSLDKHNLSEEGEGGFKKKRQTGLLSLASQLRAACWKAGFTSFLLDEIPTTSLPLRMAEDAARLVYS